MKAIVYSVAVIGLFLVTTSLFATPSGASITQNSAPLFGSRNRTAVSIDSPGRLLGQIGKPGDLLELAADSPAPNPCAQPDTPKAHGQPGNKRRYVSPLAPCRPSGGSHGNPRTSRG